VNVKEAKISLKKKITSFKFQIHMEGTQIQKLVAFTAATAAEVAANLLFVIGSNSGSWFTEPPAAS
jgi:hypothetical protein